MGFQIYIVWFIFFRFNSYNTFKCAYYLLSWYCPACIFLCSSKWKESFRRSSALTSSDIILSKWARNRHNFFEFFKLIWEISSIVLSFLFWVFIPSKTYKQTFRWRVDFSIYIQSSIQLICWHENILYCIFRRSCSSQFFCLSFSYIILISFYFFFSFVFFF